MNFGLRRKVSVSGSCMPRLHMIESFVSVVSDRKAVVALITNALNKYYGSFS
jgi:hypothetical protein